MGIGFVKLLVWHEEGDNGTGHQLCKRLVDDGFMVVVRLFRPRPNPGTLSPASKDTIRRLVAIGVRYFESTNEPGLADEWNISAWRYGYDDMTWRWLWTPSPSESEEKRRQQAIQMRSQALVNVVAACWVQDSNAIQELGGIPGLPAQAQNAWSMGSDVIGSRHFYQQVFEALVVRHQQATAKIFERGAVIFAHPATLGRPPNYPADQRNQQDHPGATYMDDDCGLMGALVPYQLLLQRFGLKAPVIGTEGLVFAGDIGKVKDSRYPAYDANGMARLTVEAFDYIKKSMPEMIGECAWLLFDDQPKNDKGEWPWESDAWVKRNGDEMPVVAAMKAMQPVPLPDSSDELNPANETFEYSPAQIEAMIREYAALEQFQLTPELCVRLALVECNSRRRKLDYKWVEPGTHATGLMQLMPNDFGPDKSGFYKCADLKDPKQNLVSGLGYLRYLLCEFGGWEKALAAWSWGPGNFRKLRKEYNWSWMPRLPDETRKMLRLVLLDGERLT